MKKKFRYGGDSEIKNILIIGLSPPPLKHNQKLWRSFEEKTTLLGWRRISRLRREMTSSSVERSRSPSHSPGTASAASRRRGAVAGIRVPNYGNYWRTANSNSSTCSWLRRRRIIRIFVSAMSFFGFGLLHHRCCFRAQQSIAIFVVAAKKKKQ